MKGWQQFETQVAHALNGRRLVNVKFSRPGDSLPDVELSRHPELKIDCKHTVHRFSHHGLLEDIRKKHCVLERDEPVLVTREGNDPNWVVSIRGEFFVRLLQSLSPLRVLRLHDYVRASNLAAQWTLKRGRKARLRLDADLARTP